MKKQRLSEETLNQLAEDIRKLHTPDYVLDNEYYADAVRQITLLYDRYKRTDFEGAVDLLIALFPPETKIKQEIAELKSNIAEHNRLKKELNNILHPKGDGPKNPSFCDLAAYVQGDLFRFKRALAKVLILCEENFHPYTWISDARNIIKQALQSEHPKSFKTEVFDIQEFLKNLDDFEENSRKHNKDRLVKLINNNIT